jgi:aminopeptidase-like protein
MMKSSGNIPSQSLAKAGADMYNLIEELYSICRSITGDGVRKTLRIIARHIPLEIHEVPSGTVAFDWTVPREWNIRDAYIEDRSGERVIDFQKSNLHVLNYSTPFEGTVSLTTLREHVFTIPERPDWVPYRTSYYKENWGFCLSQRQADALHDSEYKVCIDSDLKDGNLTYGEVVIPGSEDLEVLFSCHTCHPALCNDNLSGIALSCWVAKSIMTRKNRYTYRFLFVPGTIGPVVWLSRNENLVAKIRHGLVVACVGDAGTPTYKRSRRGNAEIDRAVLHVLERRNLPFSVREFTPYETYAEYHTSADDLNFVGPQHLADSLSIYLDVIGVLEGNSTYLSLCQKCEPQLGRRGLYRSFGGRSDRRENELALLWVMNMSDGRHSILDIAERSGLPFADLRQATDLLLRHALLKECVPGERG